MCESAFNTAGERHGNGMVCVNRPLCYLMTYTLKVPFSITSMGIPSPR
jgi:hypothetical protein